MDANFYPISPSEVFFFVIWTANQFRSIAYIVYSLCILGYFACFIFVFLIVVFCFVFIAVFLCLFVFCCCCFAIFVCCCFVCGGGGGGSSDVF